MFDLIGKRRWFYAFSSLIMIPGLIFILLTPFSNGTAGLKFSVDFTGGTVWEIHFRDGTPQPLQVKAVMDELGLPGNVAITTAGERDYVLIRTEQIGLTQFQPSPSPLPSGSPAARQRARPAPAARPARHPLHLRPPARRPARPPAHLHLPAPSHPVGQPVGIAGRSHRAPDHGSAG